MGKCIKWTGTRMCLKPAVNDTCRCAEHLSQPKIVKYVYPGDDLPTVRPPAMEGQ